MLNFKQFGNAVLAVASASVLGSCANTGGAGGGAADADSALDVKFGADAKDGTGDVAATADLGTSADAVKIGDAEGTDASGTDAVVAGGGSIAELQQLSSSTGCTTDDGKITDTGTGVTLQHVVVVSPLNTTTSKTTGKVTESLFVQDSGGGPWSGIYLEEPQGGPLAKLQVGQTLTVVGNVKEYHCYTEMSPTTVTAENTTGTPAPAVVDVDTIGASATAADNEMYEGVLISLQGVTVSDGAVLGTDGKPHLMYVGKDSSDKSVLIGAGNGLYPQDKSGKPLYAVGTKLNITGFWVFSFGQFVVTPLTIVKAS